MGLIRKLSGAIDRLRDAMNVPEPPNQFLVCLFEKRLTW